MAIYKIFPYKDSTLYSLYPNSNFGLDQISEVNNSLGITATPNVARFLTQFDSDEIQDVIDNRISGSVWDVNFKTFIANAQGINTSQTLEIYPIAQEWNNGTGEFFDSPQTQNGVTWVDSTSIGITPWVMSGNVGGVLFTGSYNSLEGGGNWFFSSSLSVSQSFNLRGDKDLDVSVKSIVSSWNDNIIPNNGFITKLPEEFEFNSTSSLQPILKYYSVDTNTIYPPQLEFKWRDYNTVLTGSLSGSIIDSSNIKLSLAENPGEFNINAINRFRLNVNLLYPPRTFQTSSYFVNNNFLPEESYYSIKDLDTNEIVFDFDNQFTQISSDSESNYFDIYMNGLEPGRYYKILIKTNIDGSVKIYDDNYYFKVING